MDEIDAALDFRNVSIIGNYIKDRVRLALPVDARALTPAQTKNAQFIIISLRNNMFELSRRLVGICPSSRLRERLELTAGSDKTNNTTKSIAVDNTDLASMA